MSTNLQTERLRRLPAELYDTWQGGVIQLPTELLGDDGKPFVPSLCIWVSTSSGRVGVNPPDAATVTPAAVVQAMVDFAHGAAGGHRPGRLEVTDATHAAALRVVVEPLGINVEVVDRLSAVEALAEHLVESMPSLTSGIDAPAALLDDPALTPERVGRFAEAAKVFYEAAPWRHFGSTDLIRVAAPKVQKPLRFINVMGGGGEQFGLAFFPSESAFFKMLEGDPGKYAEKHAMVSVTFDTDELVPPGDVAAWKTHGWPVAKRGRKPFYPFPATFDKGEWHRPSAAELSTMEGLLRALVLVTKDNLAEAEWSVRVNTADGEVRYAFEAATEAEDPTRAAKSGGASGGSLGKLGQMFGGSQSEADRLVDAAWDAGGSSRAIDLAVGAISADPDAADAYVILGNHAPTPTAAIEFFKQGVAAGERKLGAKFFKENTGMFWGILETRPYMRSMAGLAEALRATGRLDEAVAIWQRMIELNPNDNQGMRDLLACVLLHLGRDADLETLLTRYKGDGSVVFMYARALLRFRAEGDGPTAVDALRAAVASNPHMVPYLTGAKRSPKRMPETYQFGEKSEADAFGEVLAPAWRATAGAVHWIKAHAPAPARAKRPKPKSPKGRPRGMWLPPDSKPPSGL